MADLDFEGEFAWQYRIPDFDSLSLGQISYNSDELETPRNCTMSQMQRKVPKIHQDFDNWNKDIAKQVDHWMKNKPVQSGLLKSFTAQKVPLASNSQIIKRKKLQKKRLRLKDNDDSVTSKASTARGSESDYSVESDNFRRRRTHNLRHSKVKSLSVDNNDASVFGSIHNEIEFKKRYRRMFDLNKHLQFVNSTNGLMGKNILKKTHRLPPMTMKPENKPQKLECSELFAITTVQQSNDPSEITTSSSQNLIRSVESTDTSDSGICQSQLSSKEVNQTPKEIVAAERHASSWRSQKPFKPEVFKFGKLPKISNNEMDLKNEETSNRDFVDTKSITKRLNDSLQRCASWVSDSDSVHGEYAEMREMKVTINIKYKTDGRKERRKKQTIFPDSADDMSVNLTPFDRAKNLEHIADDEKCPAMFSE
uniref:Uncharacterized protein LOC111108417 isoform X3 n=1 Tax=Crassostrea virginica TaxID=6565 RepID=A0A8B8B997_CRAVI|nr:uncharacterized protein LOC111108417 isoform X3 [Crassostrea virginica]